MRTSVLVLAVGVVAAGAYFALPGGATREGSCTPVAVVTSPVSARGTGENAREALVLRAEVRGERLRSAEVHFLLLRERGDADPVYGGSGWTGGTGRASFDAGLGLADDAELRALLTQARFLKVRVDQRFRGFCEAEQVVPFSYTS